MIALSEFQAAINLLKQFVLYCVSFSFLLSDFLIAYVVATLRNIYSLEVVPRSLDLIT